MPARVDDRPPSIFISYRRSDSLDATGRIYDRLSEEFGPTAVFRDIDSIPLGVSFPELLKGALSRTDVVLVVIGPTWLTAADGEGRRRLDDPADFVRLEIETALSCDVPVIPVVVSNARLPSQSELPGPLSPLALRNGISVRPDPDFHRDMDRLISKLESLLGVPSRSLSADGIIEAQVEDLQYENELLRLEQQWQAERERHRTSFGKDPRPLEGCLAMIGGLPIAGLGFFPTVAGAYRIVTGADGGLLVMLIGMALMAIGLGFPAYHLHRFERFDIARGEFVRRRKDLIKRRAAAAERRVVAAKPKACLGSPGDDDIA
jgi:hypothetical protein